MLDELDDYDWAEAFIISNPVPAPPTDKELNCANFTREDVQRIIAAVDGQNDESSWLMVGRLKDGRYFSIDAGCDCRASGTISVARDKKSIILFGLTSEARERLGLK